MHTNNNENPSLIDDGYARINWVSQYSPVLNTLVRNTLDDGSLRGVKIAVVVHLEAKTAFLATVLADAGAEVIVAGSNPRTTNGAVVAALRDKGLTVVAEPDGDLVSWEKELVAAANLEPEYIIDDGAELTMRVLKHRPDVYARLKGVSEETTTGTARLYAMADNGQLPFPALTANDARCKHLFDNRFGTGQTTLQALLRLTNRRLTGAQLAVIGYGYVGRGIAEYARAMKANVRVVEIDPVRALEAHMDGHVVGNARSVLPGTDFVVTATGGMRAVGAPEFEILSNNTILANAGHHDLEVDVATLAELASAQSEPRNGITTYHLGERELHVLAGGALVNIAGGSGHPVEIMDLTFAVQGLGAHYLVNTALTPGVHVLPKAVDDAIATSKLANLGITLDDMRSEQNDDFAELIQEASA
ncbi:MAG: adenosylhomocysteinase [Thiolinea sp.]